MKKTRTRVPVRKTGSSAPTKTTRDGFDINRETILLAVTGMTPASLTETVWALAHEKPSVIPKRVVVITSSLGRSKVVTELLTGSPGFGGVCVWDALRQSLEEEGFDVQGRLQFGATGDDIKVFTILDSKSGRSRELDDIRTPQENAAVADFILEEVRRIVEHPDTQLIASIAGGRKTMGALLYGCLTMIGRETDRITNVLVNEPFDDSRLKPRFFYPAQPCCSLTTSDNRIVKAADAEIDLADVPFVPMRNLFRKELRRMPGRFSALVEKCRDRVQQIAAEEIHLKVRQSQPEVLVNDEPVRISPAEYIVLRFLADHAKSNRPAIDGYAAAIEPLKTLVNHVYEQHDKNDFSDWRFKVLPEQKGLDGIDDRWIIKNLSSLKSKLLDAGPVTAALIQFLPERGRFSLNILSSQIRLVK